MYETSHYTLRDSCNFHLPGNVWNVWEQWNIRRGRRELERGKEREAWTASIDLHFVTMETALLRYIYLASASWRSKYSPPPSLQIFLPCRNDRKLRQRRRRRSFSYFLTPWRCYCCLANHVTNPLRHSRSLPSRLQLPVKQAVGEGKTVSCYQS